MSKASKDVAPGEMKLTKKIVWRLPVVMAERGIYKRNKLQQMLEEIGIKLSTVQVGRIFNEPPDAIKRYLLEGLMTVLNCGLSDLMAVVDVHPEGEQPPAVATPATEVPKPKTVAPGESAIEAGIERPQRIGKPTPQQHEMPKIAEIVGERPKLTSLPPPEKKE